jgi:outer membrane receptor protein involved in Fe transport
MIKRTRLLLMTTALSAPALALTPSSAAAQAASGSSVVPLSTPQVQEIVVTAQKRSQKISDVGMAITAASGHELIDRGVTSVSGLKTFEPSLQFSPSQTGTPVYTIRGVGYYEASLAAAPAVSVYLDQVAFPFPVMSRGALLDVERVEILKGPQGTLYGQNATGGAVNFVPNRPTNAFAWGFDESFGRFEDNLLSGFISGPLSPTLNARLSFSTENGGAWQRSVTRDDKLGNKDTQIGRLILDWRPTQVFRASLNVNGFTDNSDAQANQLEGIRFLDPQYLIPPTAVPGGANNPAYYLPVAPLSQYPTVLQPFLANQPAPANDRAADWTAGTHPRNHERFYQGVLRLDYDFASNLGITSLTSYQHYTQANQHDLAGVSVESTAGVLSGKIDTFSQELRLHGVDFDNRLQWLLGANFEADNTHEEQNFNQFLISASFLTGGSPQSLLPLTPFTNYSATSDSRMRTYSAFANAEYHLLSNVDFHAGIRYTQSNQKFNSCSIIDDPGIRLFEGFTLAALNGTAPPVVSPGTCLVFHGAPGSEFLGPSFHQLDENNVPWRVGVDWKVRPNALIYFTVSKGYKAGGSPTLGATSDLQYTPVTQESLVAYEFGTKALLFGRTLQLDGSIFHYDYSNKQVLGRILDPTGIFGALQTLVNIPQSTEDGAELSAFWKPLRGLSLNASATYLNSKVTSSFVNFASYITGPTDTVDFKGESFPFTPKWSLTYGARYEWPVSDHLTAFVSANGAYQSKTNAAFGSAHAAAEGPPLDIKGYGVLDLAVGLESSDGHWRAQLWGRNVTDTYYWTNVFYAEDTTARTAGMPATFGISLSYRH